jgi:hypothetical protein
MSQRPRQRAGFSCASLRKQKTREARTVSQVLFLTETCPFDFWEYLRNYWRSSFQGSRNSYITQTRPKSYIVKMRLVAAHDDDDLVFMANHQRELVQRHMEKECRRTLQKVKAEHKVGSL